MSSATYLSEAEPFLEQYAKRSLENQALIGSAGNLVRSEDFLAIVDEGKDEEGDLEPQRDMEPPSHSTPVKDSVPKDQGLIVFFPGILSLLYHYLMSLPFSRSRDESSWTVYYIVRHGILQHIANIDQCYNLVLEIILDDNISVIYLEATNLRIST